MNKKLYYAHDPMCSWCWGFEPVRKQFFNNLSQDIELVRLVGGLAPDSIKPMPADMQLSLQNTWKKIQQAIPNTQFNFDFWSQCQPRRSTYPANRAILAAKLQGIEYDELMTQRIQQAYYREAKNPSDDSVLIELATELGLDTQKFTQDLTSDFIQQSLEQEILKARSLRLNSFPSLAYQVNNTLHHIQLDYLDANTMLNQIRTIDASSKETEAFTL